MLNGTSSAGKSTLTRALQARLGGPWLGVGIDTGVFALPKAYRDLPHWAEIFRYVPAEAGSDPPFRSRPVRSGTGSSRGCTEWSRRSPTRGCG